MGNKFLFLLHSIHSIHIIQCCIIIYGYLNEEYYFFVVVFILYAIDVVVKFYENTTKSINMMGNGKWFENSM